MTTSNTGPILDELARQVAQQSETLAMHIAIHASPYGAAGSEAAMEELSPDVDIDTGQAIANAARREIAAVQEQQKRDTDRLEQKLTEAIEADRNRTGNTLDAIRQEAGHHATALHDQLTLAKDSIRDENAGHLATLQEHHRLRATELESTAAGLLSQFQEHQTTGLQTLQDERIRLAEIHQQETERQRTALATTHQADMAANLLAYETATAEARRSLIQAHRAEAEKSASEYQLAVETALTTLQNAHQAATATAASQHEQAMTGLQDAHKTAMADAETRHEQAMTTLQDSHRTAMADAETRHQQAVQHLVEQFQAAMKQAAKDLDDDHKHHLDSTTTAIDNRHRRFTHRLIAVATAASGIAIAAIIVTILL